MNTFFLNIIERIKKYKGLEKDIEVAEMLNRCLHKLKVSNFDTFRYQLYYHLYPLQSFASLSLRSCNVLNIIHSFCSGDDFSQSFSFTTIKPFAILFYPPADIIHCLYSPPTPTPHRQCFWLSASTPDNRHILLYLHLLSRY